MRCQLKLIDCRDNFNFIQAGDEVIAISQATGQVKLFEERLGERELPPLLFVGESLEEVREKALAEAARTAQPDSELVGDTTGYNLVRVGERFLALAKVLGPISPMVERLGERELAPLLFSGESLEEVRGKALAFEKETAVPNVELIDEIGRYNVIKAGERFIAIAKELGPVNLLRERLGERELAPLLFAGDSLEEVREKALAFEKENRPPSVELIESEGGYNLLKAGDRYFAVAKALGAMSLLQERLGERDLPPVLFLASSLAEARCMVAGLQNIGPGVLDVYKGFNILWAGDGFFGVRQSIGPFDPSKVRGFAAAGEYEGNVVFGESVEIVREKIDARGQV